MKSFVLLLAAVFLCGALPGVTPEELRKRSGDLEARAETLRAADPDFVDFIREQAGIHRSFEKAYQYERQNNPEAAPGILDDWNALVSRMEKEYEIFRAMPDLEKRGRLDVRDFGAKGDGETDDTEAVRKAVNTAKEQGKGVVFFPKGTYFLKHASGREAPVIAIKDARNLKLKGENGTVLLMDHPRPPYFLIDRCENLRFEDLHVTSVKPHYSTGIVTGFTADGTGFYVHHEGGLPPTDSSFAASDFGNSGPVRGGLIRLMSAKLAEDGRTPCVYGVTWGELGHNFWSTRFVTAPGKDMYIGYPSMEAGTATSGNRKTSARDYVEIGRRIVIQARDHSGAFRVLNSPRCRFTRISMDCTAGLTFKTQASDLMFITDSTIAAPVNAPFSFSSVADFYFATAATAGGFVARNVVKNLSDDYLNIHGVLLPVLRKEGNCIYISGHEIPDYQLPFLRTIDLVPTHEGNQLITNKTRYRVKSAVRVMLKHAPEYLDPVAVRKGEIRSVPGEPEEIDTLKLELDRDPGEIKTTDPYIKWGEVHGIRAFAGKKEFTLVHMPDLYSQGQVVSGNYFADGVSRVWEVGSGSIVKDNTFSQPGGGQFWCYDWNYWVPWWSEAFFPRVVTIENNTFRVADVTMFTMGNVRYDAADPASYLKHIFIRNNRIISDQNPGFMYEKPLFEAAGVADLELVGNTFLSWHRGQRTRFVLKDVDAVIADNKFLGNFGPDNLGPKVKISKERSK